MINQVSERPATRIGAIVLALMIASIEQSSAFIAPGKPATPNFDRRRDASPPLQLAPERQKAIEDLQGRLPGVRTDFDRATGAPSWVSTFGFLSGPTDAEIQRTGSLGLAADDPHRAIKAFLVENRDLFGHGPEALATAAIAREFVTEHNGMRSVVWQQQLDGIPVFEAVLIGHITKRGELVNISSQFLPDPEKAAGLDQPGRLRLESATAITAVEALANAVRNVGETMTVDAIVAAGAASATPERLQKFTAAPLFSEARVGLAWLPMDRSSVRLCWSVEFISRSTLESFRTLVDAASGKMLVRQNLTCRYSDVSYLIYPSDSPSPFSPGYTYPSSVQPPIVGRQVITLPALSSTASPQGWMRDTDNLTLGNNVDASLNRGGAIPNPTPRPQGSPFRVFEPPLDLAQDPYTYGDAATVSLFYWCNWMHDKLYALGFTEAAGNFQDDNFGRGGVPGDRILAYAQFGANFGDADNAYFFPAPDGTSGMVWMFLWDMPSPMRDGDLDAEVVLHEYTHGLSTRLVGGGVGISALQTAGMGEGWSDFYALSMLSESSDNVNGNYAEGGYVTYQLGGLTENYYYGIRRYPYSTDMTKNPVTFKDIDPNQADPHAGIAVSPIIGGSADEPHNQGEVWCVTLWEARANLINHYGYATGSQLILRLVTDGMKLCPPNPNFIQARDAILQADLVDNSGANLTQLWAAFAKRGMGASASAPDSSTTYGVVESYGAPSFTPTGSLHTARYGHTAVLVGSGTQKVLAAGGVNNGTYLSSVELYDPTTGTWATRPPMVWARYLHTATLLSDGRVLAAGGFGTGGSYLNSAEVYNPINGMWTPTGSMNAARTYHRAMLLPNGKVLVAGGYNSSGNLSSAELYDPTSGSWTPTSPMNAARSQPTVALLPDNNVLVAGGSGASGYLSSSEIYDWVGGTWATTAGSMATARRQHTAVSLPDGSVLVAGGWNSSGYVSGAELYDPASGMWTVTGSLTERRGNHTATLLVGGQVQVLATGGNPGPISAVSAEVYDSATGTWRPAGRMNGMRQLHTATLLPNGNVLVAGGLGPVSGTATAELYNPGL